MSANFRAKIQNSWLKKPILRIFMNKIEVINIHNLLCQKFATFCPPTTLLVIDRSSSVQKSLVGRKSIGKGRPDTFAKQKTPNLFY